MMPGIYWFRPIGFDERDCELEDLPPLCECEDPECEGCQPLNEDAGIDAYYEDSQSPSIEDYLDTAQQAERLFGDEHRQRVRG